MEVVGYIESVDLPEIELFGLDAKIDTGAERCSIHCDDVKIEGDNVTFLLHDKVHSAYHGKIITMPVYKIDQVKSSNGISEERVFIYSDIKMGCKTYKAEISLANRKSMKYPMLVGKRFMSKRFLVDVSHKHITKKDNN